METPLARPPLTRRTTAATLGLIAIGLVTLLVLAAAAVLALATYVDEMWANMLVLPALGAMAVGPTAMLLSVIGLVLAWRSRRGFAWPIVGLAAGTAPLVFLRWWIVG